MRLAKLEKRPAYCIAEQPAERHNTIEVAERVGERLDVVFLQAVDERPREHQELVRRKSDALLLLRRSGSGCANGEHLGEARSDPFLRHEGLGLVSSVILVIWLARLGRRRKRQSIVFLVVVHLLVALPLVARALFVALLRRT